MSSEIESSVTYEPAPAKKAARKAKPKPAKKTCAIFVLSDI